MSRILCIVVLLSVAGCEAQTTTPPRNLSTGESRAIEIARGAVEQNDTWSDRATFEPHRAGEGWIVYVERQPAVPGGHRWVAIDKAGNVTEYARGR